MPTSPIQLVIFDLGRVLIRICDHWQEACNLAGVQSPKCLTDKATIQHMLALGMEHESGRLENDAYYARAGQLTGLSPREVESIAIAWLKGPFPGSHALVADLHAKGIATACLSNTNALHWQLMHDDPRHRLPLRELKYAFASHLIGVMKPHADIYEHVEKTTGLPGDAIVFFDDNADNITAAHARGWHAVRIDTQPACTSVQMRQTLRELGVL